MIGALRSAARRVMMFLNEPLVGLLGSLDEWRAHWERRRDTSSPAEGLTHLTGSSSWPGEGADSAPVFLLAASWRSGSTLLQRLILSSGSVFMWGETYPHCDLVRRLADSARAFSEDYPPEDMIRLADHRASELTREWIATLSPEPERLARAHRRFFCELLEEPARERGFERWGYKEVRLTLEHARYLRWLFPSAKFVFLVRNPYHAYASYRSVSTWYDRWPDRPVMTARHFGRHWRERAGGFVRRADEVDGLLIRFEDVVRGGGALERLEDHLGVSVDRSVLEVKKSGTSGERHRLSPFDRFLLSTRVEPTAERLGYASRP